MAQPASSSGRTTQHPSISSRRRMSRHLDDVRFHQLTPEEEEEERRQDTCVRRKDATAIYVEEEEISFRAADGMKSSIQDRLDTEPCPHAPDCNLVRTGACIYEYHPGQEVTEQCYYIPRDPKIGAADKVVKIAKHFYPEKFPEARTRNKFRLTVNQIMAKRSLSSELDRSSSTILP